MTSQSTCGLSGPNSWNTGASEEPIVCWPTERRRRVPSYLREAFDFMCTMAGVLRVLGAKMEAHTGLSERNPQAARLGAGQWWQELGA
jgi:hypothetical protein